MCEFKGVISGEAEKFFIKKSRNMLLGFLALGFGAILPVFVYLSFTDQLWVLLLAYCSMFVFFSALTFLPLSKKRKDGILPQKIYTDSDNYIICILKGGHSDSRLIDDAKFLVDHGEFYEIKFPFGKVSEKFVCQKSLLVNGTLEDFESKFEGKIIRK